MKHPLYNLMVICWMFMIGNRDLRSAILYVDASSFNGGSGVSWEEAYANLQDALLYASSGDEIWVTAGDYFPDYGDAVFEGDRYESFTLKSGVSLYGGFIGNETARDQRNYNANISRLKGQIGTQSDGSEDSIHVVIATEVDGTAVLDGFTIEGGSADSGTGEYSKGGGIYIADGSPTLANVTFSDNQGYFGAAVYISGSDSQPAFTDCTFSSNAAFYDGGAVYSDGASPTFIKCNFSFNYALDGIGGGAFVSGIGTLHLKECTFSNNESIYGGGGLTVFSASPSIMDTVFSSNSATNGLGGGMEIDSGNPIIEGCSFLGNSSNYGGGGISIWTGSPQIINSTFAQNQDAGTYGGGGVFSYSSSAMFTDCEFEGNFANYGAGAYLIEQVPTFNNCSFTSNVQLDDTKQGGGAGIFNYNSSPVLKGCTFSWNTAKVGGAVYSYYSAISSTNPKILNCTFSNNSTLVSGQGGAIANWNVHPSIYNCSFKVNIAAFGGAIWNQSTSVGGILVNSLFVGNSATDSGGAIYCPAKSYNCTFSNNSAQSGAAIYDLAGNVLSNCILYGNNATLEGNPIYGDLINVQYSLVEGGFLGTGNLDSDPLFSSPDSGDYTLKPDSPAINVGDHALLPADYLDLNNNTDLSEPVPFDLLGNPRLYESEVDMGAYEFYVQDDDQDQLPDDWELTYGLNIFLNDADDDPDGDGFSNLAEYLLGNNPRSSEDRFHAKEAIHQGGGNYELSWSSNVGKVYYIQTSYNLTDWTDIAGTHKATSSLTTAVVSIPLDTNSAFFRVQLVTE